MLPLTIKLSVILLSGISDVEASVTDLMEDLGAESPRFASPGTALATLMSLGKRAVWRDAGPFRSNYS